MTCYIQLGNHSGTAGQDSHDKAANLVVMKNYELFTRLGSLLVNQYTDGSRGNLRSPISSSDYLVSS